MLDSNIFGIIEGGIIYSKYNLFIIFDKRFCCGGDILLLCCVVGLIKVFSIKCGKILVLFILLFFVF